MFSITKNMTDDGLSWKPTISKWRDLMLDVFLNSRML